LPLLMRSAVGNWWNGLDPNVHGAIIIVAVAAAIILTAGVAAVPLAGTAPGSILMAAAVGATIGAVTDAALYTGITLATGGQWSFEGMAQAAAIGALVGGVTAGAGKAFSLWRAGALAGRAGALAADGGTLEVGAVTRYGTLIKNPGIKITSFSKHALDRMVERGITREMMEGIVTSGKTLPRGGGRYLFVNEEGAVVLSRTGRVITTWSRTQFEPQFWEAFWQLGFR